MSKVNRAIKVFYEENDSIFILCKEIREGRKLEAGFGHKKYPKLKTPKGE